MVAKMNRYRAEAGHDAGRHDPQPPADAAGDEMGAAGQGDPLTDLQQKLEEAQKRAEDCHDRYVRALAELDNYRKRAAREKTDAIQYGNENLLRDILPLVDGMDRALEHACNSDDFDAFRKGLKLLQGQLLACLQKHGVEAIDTAGKGFDPHVHEALMQVESPEHRDSQVVSEFERGYTLKGRLLRPAKVSVCRNPSRAGGVCEPGSDDDLAQG